MKFYLRSARTGGSRTRDVCNFPWAVCAESGMSGYANPRKGFHPSARRQDLRYPEDPPLCFKATSCSASLFRRGLSNVRAAIVATCSSRCSLLYVLSCSLCVCVSITLNKRDLFHFIQHHILIYKLSYHRNCSLFKTCLKCIFFFFFLRG